MAEGMNRVTLLGNLGADPELKMTPGGQAVMSLRLATTESYLDQQRVRQERTEWHKVNVWGKQAESLAKLLSKGERVLVEGRIQTRSYDDRDGNKKYFTEIVATKVYLCGSGRRDREAVPSGGQQDSWETSPPEGDEIPF